jgi:hypothetical protein
MDLIVIYPFLGVRYRMSVFVRLSFTIKLNFPDISRYHIDLILQWHIRPRSSHSQSPCSVIVSSDSDSPVESLVRTRGAIDCASLIEVSILATSISRIIWQRDIHIRSRVGRQRISSAYGHIIHKRDVSIGM